MMTFELITALIAFAFVSSITPGPNNLMLMASGINFGMTRTLPHMFGVCLGFTFMLTLIGLGLIQIFDALPVSYLILKIFSITYLSYLAWKIATSTPVHSKASDDETAKPLTFIQAALFQWINPKAWMMCVTAMSTYSASDKSIMSVLIVAVIFGAINLPAISVWTFLGVQLQRVLNSPLKLRAFNITAALLLMASLYPVIFTASF